MNGVRSREVKDDLRRQLGREPTGEELEAHLLVRHQVAA